MVKKTSKGTHGARVDSGNGGVNADVDGKLITFPSVRAPVTGASLGLGGQWEASHEWADWRGHRHTYGDGVLASSIRGIERHIGDQRYGNEFDKFLTAVAIAKGGVKDGTVSLTRFVPPGMYSQYRDLMIESYMSEEVAIQLKGDKKPRVWEYSSVDIWPEALAAAACIMLNDKGEPVNEDLFEGDVLLIDVGTYTVNATLISDGQFDPEALQVATFKEQGIHNHIRQPLLQLVQSAGDAFQHVTVDHIDAAFRAEKPIVRSAGKEVDLTDALGKYALRHAEWIANNILDSSYRGLRNVTRAFVSGGFADLEAPLLRKWYDTKIFDRTKNATTAKYHPAWWNAIGGRRLAAAMAEA